MMFFFLFSVSGNASNPEFKKKKNSECLLRLRHEGLLNSCPAGVASCPASSCPFRSPRSPRLKLLESALLLGPRPTAGGMEFSELIRTGRAQAELLRGPGAPPLRGTLCVTGHHLLLSPGPQATSDLWLLLLRSVDSIEKRVAGDSGTITLRCKDLRVLQLDIEGVEATLDIARSIEALSSLESVITSFPFFYRPKGLRLGDAWHFHPPEHYYKRVARETNAWRLSEVNEDFSVCPSYPRAVIVPRAVDDDALARSARFRQGGRFPVLSYHHAPSGTVLLRSSQPLTGPQKRRCAEDEELLRAVLAGARPGARGFIVDTRSAQAAKQARMTGGGTEAKAAYPGWKRLHRPMERGRPLQESFVRLVEACGDLEQSMDRWLSRLEGCRWLAHVKEALSTACLAAQGMERCLCEVRTRTHSLWSGLNQPKEQRKLRNPLYVLNPLAIWPSVEPQSLRLWQGLFLRWTRPPEPSEAAWEKVWQIVTDKEKTEGSQPTVSASEPQP
nr:myotubularin-related protein 9 isoform X2 [Equus caballus]